MKPSPRWAFEAYQRIRCQLPELVSEPVRPQQIPSLEVICDRFDGFIFDAFRVLAQCGQLCLTCGSRAVPRSAVEGQALFSAFQRRLSSPTGAGAEIPQPRLSNHTRAINFQSHAGERSSRIRTGTHMGHYGAYIGARRPTALPRFYHWRPKGKSQSRKTP